MLSINYIVGSWNDPKSTLPAPLPRDNYDDGFFSDEVLLWIRLTDPETQKEGEFSVGGRYDHADQAWDVFIDVEDPKVLAWSHIQRPSFLEDCKIVEVDQN